MTDRDNNGRPVALRICVFGETGSGKTKVLEKIQAMLEDEGIAWRRGVDSPDVESIHVESAS